MGTHRVCQTEQPVLSNPKVAPKHDSIGFWHICTLHQTVFAHAQEFLAAHAGEILNTKAN